MSYNEFLILYNQILKQLEPKFPKLFVKNKKVKREYDVSFYDEYENEIKKVIYIELILPEHKIKNEKELERLKNKVWKSLQKNPFIEFKKSYFNKFEPVFNDVLKNMKPDLEILIYGNEENISKKTEVEIKLLLEHLSLYIEDKYPNISNLKEKLINVIYLLQDEYNKNELNDYKDEYNKNEYKELKDYKDEKGYKEYKELKDYKEYKKIINNYEKESKKEYKEEKKVNVNRLIEDFKINGIDSKYYDQFKKYMKKWVINEYKKGYKNSSVLLDHIIDEFDITVKGNRKQLISSLEPLIYKIQNNKIYDDTLGLFLYYLYFGDEA